MVVQLLLTVSMHILFKVSKLWLICSIAFSVFVCTVESLYLELRLFVSFNISKIWFVDSSSQHYLFWITGIYPI